MHIHAYCVQTKLREFEKEIADITSATIAHVTLKTALYQELYHPLPSAKPLKDLVVYAELDTALETVMTTIPNKLDEDGFAPDGEDDLRGIILAGMLRHVVEAMCHALRGFRSAKRLHELTDEDPELSISEVERGGLIIASDAQELASFFHAAASGHQINRLFEEHGKHGYRRTSSFSGWKNQKTI